MTDSERLEFRPLSMDNWGDLLRLFEGHGNLGYCWCTFWRLSSGEYRALDSAGRKGVLGDFVRRSIPTGILGYLGGRAVGWCSVAPRETYSRLTRSRSIRRVDDRPTWSVVCFYMDRRVRGRSVSIEFLGAAVAHAAAQGAEVVEGYPVEPEHDAEGNWAPAKSYRFMGYRSTFERAGFKDATPAGSRRLVMRYIIQDSD